MKVVSKDIDVIASFVKNSKPLPMRFRMVEEDESIVINIDKVISINRDKLAGNNMYVYKCTSSINGKEKLFELKYDLEKCNWILFKI